ncbi:hypothetical protein ACP3VV_20050, partial [Vibrio sp. PNB22_8_2]
MAKYGRRPEQMRVLTGVTIIVGEREGEAERLFQELEDLVSPAVAVDYLAKMLGRSLKGCPIDGPLPPLDPTQVDGTQIGAAIAAM